jgi:hypothetical protein
MDRTLVNMELLKQTLITMIQQTEDVELLNAIKVLLEVHTSSYALSEAQKESIEISHRQIEAGEFFGRMIG